MKSFPRKDKNTFVDGGHVNLTTGNGGRRSRQRDGEEIRFRLLSRGMQQLPKRGTRKKRGGSIDGEAHRTSRDADSGMSKDTAPQELLEAVESEDRFFPGLGLGNLDPFNTLPFLVTERTQSLLHYCI